MTFRSFYSIALVGVLFSGLFLADRAVAAESVVSDVVDADTWITWESDNASRGDENHGADQDMRVRSGNSDLTNAVRKPLIRFDITGQTINPAAIYLFEVTTESDGTSSSTHTINAITDPLLQNFDELTLTWNNAPPSAGYVGGIVALGNEQVASFNAAGPAVGTFLAPGAPETAIQTTVLGSDLIDAVFSDGGSSLLTFGIGGSNNSTLELQSKESVIIPPAPARLLTFDLFESAGGGLITDGSTWSGGAVPSAGNQYAVVNGDAVTADGSAPFNGEALGIANGSLNYSASGVLVPLVIVADGMAVTESTAGEFFLGDINALTLGRMVLNGDLTITAENGADAALDMAMSGAGTATVNVESGGTMYLTDMSGFEGVLQFNGSGDEVLYEGPPGSDMTLEMNSTGSNKLTMNPDDNGGTIDNIIFNQPGEMDHKTVDTLGPRLIQPGALTANASVSIDLTKTYATNERRFLFGPGLAGSASVTVNGTATDPTVPASNISLNEFETGGSSEDPLDTHMETQSYTGTVTANDFVNVEIRRHLPGGAIVVNQNAVLDMGWDEAVNIFSTRIGEVTVNSGATLEVGFSTQPNDSVVRHNPFNLQLTTQRGRSGDLTLAAGSKTVMQISGDAVNQFDTISAEGTVALGGTLEVLINPMLTDFYIDDTDPLNPVPDFAYVPTDGDTFEIISIVANTLATDFDGNGSVGSEDLALWQELFGQTLEFGDNQDFDVTADADGDGDTDGADFLAWQRNVGASGTVTGSISGDFDDMVIVDPDGVLAGFKVTKAVTATAVTLTISANPLATAVPEPSAALLAALALVLAAGVRGWGSPRTMGK